MGRVVGDPSGRPEGPARPASPGHPGLPDREERVAMLVDEFASATRAGRGPSLDAFVAAHADLEKDLRAALKALAFVGLAAGDIDRDRARHEPPADGTLGDFRIVREV